MPATMKALGVKCPHCGTFSNDLGPPHAWFPDGLPAGQGWPVVMLVCPNPGCQAPLGTYSHPPDGR